MKLVIDKFAHEAPGISLAVFALAALEAVGVEVERP